MPIKYALPPLVLYENHADRSASDFLIKQLPQLKKAGYMTICVDGIESGASLEKNISMMQQIIQLQVKNLSQLPLEHPEHTQEVEKLRSVVAKLDLFQAMKDQGFRLGGIDLSASERLKEPNPNSIRREKTLTDNTLNEVQKNAGGVVVLLGFDHCIFQQMIKNHDENAAQYLWLHVHNPDYATPASTALVTAYTKKGYAEYFPLGIDIFKNSFEKLDAVLWDKISANYSNYGQTNLETSTASILKSLLGPKVTTQLRHDSQHARDVPVHTIEETPQVKSSGFLKSLSQTLGSIKSKMAKIKTEDQVIVRGNNEPK